MIAKSLIFFLLAIIVPDLYLGWRYLRKRRWWQQVLWYLPGVALLAATLVLARGRDFVPDDMTWFCVYLLTLAMTAGAKLLFSVCSLFGRKGRVVGLAAIPLLWLLLLYGSFVGNRQLEVKRVELAFKDLPAAFDGYRIVQFSDIHLGSMDSLLLCRAVDSINAQQADLIAFTGDIQNKKPDEILRFQDLLSTLSAKDGVVSVMGNHDYPYYMNVSEEQQYMNEEKTIGYQQDMKWKVLVNGHFTVRRDSDAIVIAGIDNDGEGRFANRANINTTLWGVTRDEFVVMLSHTPASWRPKILSHSHAQLTLSGHTHGMQFQLFGWTPMSLWKPECYGLYHVGDRYINVSKGLGGVVPFRLGATPEIVIITLRKS